jgi:hypothetical protein
VGEGGEQQGAPQVGGILLGRLPQFGLPPALFTGGERKEEEGGKEGGGRIPPRPFSLPLFPSPQVRPIWGGASALASCCVSPLGPLGPYLFRGGVPGTPSSDLICTRYPLEHFRWPNTIILYINLYLSTISRLLIMSVISSGTPNNIRSPNHITHIILYRHRTLSVRTLRVREICRHDRDTSPVNNQ